MYVCSVYIHLFRTHEFNRRPVSEMSHIQILFGKFNFYFWLFTFNISERQWYLYYYSSDYQYIHEIYKLLKKFWKRTLVSGYNDEEIVCCFCFLDKITNNCSCCIFVTIFIIVVFIDTHTLTHTTNSKLLCIALISDDFFRIPRCQQYLQGQIQQYLFQNIQQIYHLMRWFWLLVYKLKINIE